MATPQLYIYNPTARIRLFLDPCRSRRERYRSSLPGRYLMLGLTKHGPRKADAETPSGSLLCVCAGVIARRDGCQSSLGITPAGLVVTPV